MNKLTLTLIAVYFLYLTNNLLAQNEELGSSSLPLMTMITVTIGGEFIINGSYSASKTERLDQFITRIYNEAKAVNLSFAKDYRTYVELKEEVKEFSKRGIKLIKADGSIQIIDLEKFRLTGDFSQNPYLENDDIIIFRTLDWDRNFIEVEGAVNKPVVFEFIDGDQLSDALLFARGINPAYSNVDSAAIIRLSYDGTSEEVIKIGINDQFKLQRGDRIRILAEETQKRDFKVLVSGEVYKPGYIYITKDNTTIQDVIIKAGGFKPDADLNKAELIRNSQAFGSIGRREEYQDRRRPFNLLAFSRRTDLLMMQRMSDIEVEDSLTFLSDNELRFSRANVSVDFSEVFNDSSESSQFIVKDGDLIFVPEKENLVYVFGQVMKPGFTDFKEGRGYEYYIQSAGGVGKLAKSEVYLIKGKTRSWIDMTDEEDYEIEAGDYIWIPKDVPRNFDYYLTRTAQIASVIGAVATVVLLFK